MFSGAGVDWTWVVFVSEDVLGVEVSGGDTVGCIVGSGVTCGAVSGIGFEDVPSLAATATLVPSVKYTLCTTSPESAFTVSTFLIAAPGLRIKAID